MRSEVRQVFSIGKEGGSNVPEGGDGICKGPGDHTHFSIAVRDDTAFSPSYLAEISFTSSLGQLKFPKPSTKIASFESKRKQQTYQAQNTNMGKKHMKGIPSK